VTGTTRREASYGQHRSPTVVDRFGVWLGSLEVRRNISFAGARFADLGCGFHARLAVQQLPVAASAVLVDVALDDQLKRQPKVTAIEGSLPLILPQFESRSFDVVLCLSVLEHLWDPQDTLTHIRRILAPGGVAAVNVPSWLGKPLLELAAFRLGVSPAEEMNDHKSYYDPRDLWPMLVRAGFRPQDIRCHRHKFGLNTSAICRAVR
jgi:2-polyprenyl-3-methyl-5-hydroxy-6-metoxy-1,4-benzoquinol methylase